MAGETGAFTVADRNRQTNKQTEQPDAAADRQTDYCLVDANSLGLVFPMLPMK